MTETSPPPAEPERTGDRDLRLLAALHFAMACLCVAGIGLLAWQYRRVHDAILAISPSRGRGGSSPLDPFFATFRLYYLAGGAVLGAVGAGNLLSGILIRLRRWRLVSLAVACLNCVLVPVGTALAALAMVVLLREPVRRAYADRAAAPVGGASDAP